MHGIDAPIVERKLRAGDGTEIAYYTAGRGKGRLILAPGLGTHLIAWKYLIEDFQDRYTIITWDPRGTYGSDVPNDLESLRVEDHVRDMAAIVEEIGWDSFVLGGWSMGVQISLEYYSRFPEKVRGLMLINGTYEHVLSTAFALPAADKVFVSVLHGMRRMGPVLNPLLSFALSLDVTPALLERTHLLANNAKFFSRLVKPFSTLDWGVYFKMMLLYNQHSAAPHLPGVRVPTLVTAGTGDLMTPVATAQHMAETIPGAELFVIPKGTHYTLVEYPEILNLRVERFLRDRDPELF